MLFRSVIQETLKHFTENKTKLNQRLKADFERCVLVDGWVDEKNRGAFGHHQVQMGA